MTTTTAATTSSKSNSFLANPAIAKRLALMQKNGNPSAVWARQQVEALEASADTGRVIAFLDALHCEFSKIPYDAAFSQLCKDAPPEVYEEIMKHSSGVHAALALLKQAKELGTISAT